MFHNEWPAEAAKPLLYRLREQRRKLQFGQPMVCGTGRGGENEKGSANTTIVRRRQC